MLRPSLIKQSEIMNTKSFSLIAEELLDALLDQLESFEELEDLDIDLIDGVLTVVFEDNSQVIINRQEPVQQIWLASPEGPAHFAQNDDGQWINIKSDDEFYTTLSRVFTAKSGSEIQLDA